MNPKNDLFVSTSKDSSTRLWDLAQKKLVAIYEHGKTAAFDNTGMVLGVAFLAAEVNKESKDAQKYYINLYETTPCKGVPFSTFELDEGEVKQLKFSNNGQSLLCSTDSGYCILDAYTGDKRQKFEPLVTPESGISLEGSFTPDGQYFMCGSENGVIIIWNVTTGKQICKLEKHFKAVNCIKFSNKYAILVSACQNLLFWQPQSKINETTDDAANSQTKRS